MRTDCCEFLRDISLVILGSRGGPRTQILRRWGITGSCTSSLEDSVNGVFERDKGDLVCLDRSSDATEAELSSNSGPESSTMTVSGVISEDSSDSAWNLLAILLVVRRAGGMPKIFQQAIILRRQEGKVELGKGNSPPILRLKRPRKDRPHLSQSDPRN